MTRPWLSPDRRVRIAELHQAGKEPRQIAEQAGVRLETVKRWIDPAWREKRNRQIAAVRERGGGASAGRIALDSARADVEARFAEIPPDTRGLTARLFGDPIPGDPRRATKGGRA